MADLVLIGPAVSSYVRTARMTCIEKGVPHTLEPLELGSDAHKKLHPWGRVPVLRHGDVTLIETSAIARYVDETASGPKLVPSTPVERAVMEQWISAINCYIYDSLVRNYALKYILPRFAGESPDPQAIKAGVPNMERDFALLDGAYAKSKFITGEALSLADLFVAPVVATAAIFPEGQAALGKAKNLARAFETFTQRESFKKVHEGLPPLK